MSDRLNDWLSAAGFDTEPVDAETPSADDPWGRVEIEVVALDAEQVAFLRGEVTLELDDPLLTDDDLAAAAAEIIEIPEDIDRIDPFEA